MGILRLYLALCVVADHGGPVLPWRMHTGSQAVQMFYIISGFYMAMVLSSRYAKPRDFYLSRFLRIFPPYWLVLAATFVLSLAGGLFFDRWLMLRTYINHPFEHNGVAGILLSVLLNLTLIGQDWLMFLKHDIGHALQFTADWSTDPSPLWRYLVLPQSWTIGVELTFYALAPFLNRLRSGWLVAIVACSFAARLGAYRYLGLAHDPWEYRFFPFEIGLFLFGMLGFRLYAKFSADQSFLRWQALSRLSYIAGAVVLLIIMYFHVWLVQFLERLIDPHLAVLVTYPLFIIAIPVLFLVSGKNGIDRLIGEMSYPVYLVHYLVIVVVANLLNIGPGAELGRISAVASVVLAALMYRKFIAPLDRKRHDLSVKKPIKAH
jgi:peptidoglycan/LPS O-acetylase OafA/YrhL